MPIIAKYPSKQFTPCPPGLHQAVCVDVVDLGEVATTFGPKDKVRLVFQIAEIDPASGHRHDVIKSYNNTMHKKASLRTELEMWRGRAFTEAEAQSFDLETLLGVNAMIQVVHKISETSGETYANLAVVLPLPKGTPRIVGADYTRSKDRTSQSGATPPPRPAVPLPTKPVPRPAAPEPDTPLAAVSAAAPLEVPADESDDDVSFAFGANDKASDDEAAS